MLTQSNQIELGEKVVVFREDDNGNRFTVGTYPSMIEAKLKIEELEQGQHKQFYWAEAVCTPSNPRAASGLNFALD